MKDLKNLNRVLLKLSGEALAGEKKFGFDEATVLDVAAQVKQVVDSGVQVAIVIGGGNFWRGRTSENMDRIRADQIGMLATVMNCIYVSDLFRHAGLLTKVFTPFVCGSFTELYKSNCGQVSINKIKPGITKGNHYHHNKFEMFTVVSGNCEIVEKNIFTGNIKKYLVSGEEIVNIYMSPGWSHTIKNIGTKDAIVVMYASEIYNSKKPDTYVYNI